MSDSDDSEEQTHIQPITKEELRKNFVKTLHEALDEYGKKQGGKQ